jgi:hypothetical protein
MMCYIFYNINNIKEIDASKEEKIDVVPTDEHFNVQLRLWT